MSGPYREAARMESAPEVPRASVQREYRPRGPLALEPQAFGFLFDVADEPQVETRGDVAIVTVRGPLMHHEDWCFDSYDSIRGRVQAAIETKPRAIVLSIDSPGGVVSGCMETSDALRSMAAAAGVPLYSYVDGQACSGGYALACAGARVYTPPAGTLGSIGVIAAMVDARQQAAMAGVAVELVTSGARKSDGHPLAGISDAARAATKSTVDTLAAVFWGVVARARGMSVDAVRAFEAGVMHGEAAVGAGLADKVATLDELIAEISTGAIAAPQGGHVAASEDEKDVRAKLRKMADEGDEKAKAALAAFGDEDEDDKGDDDADASAEGGDDDAGDDDEKRPDPDASASARLATAANTSDQRIDRLERKLEAADLRELFASRPDVGPSVRKALEGIPFAKAKKIVDGIPKPKLPKPAASAVVPSTRGDGQGDTAASRLSAERKAELDAAMGLTTLKPTVETRGNTLVLGATRPTARKEG